MSEAIDRIYRAFDYFIGFLEPESRDDLLDALEINFTFNIPATIDARYKANKELNQEVPMLFKQWLYDKIIEFEGELQIGKLQYQEVEPFQNLPNKYFYDDTQLREGFARIAREQSKEKLN